MPASPCPIIVLAALGKDLGTGLEDYSDGFRMLLSNEEQGG
jgi:hypothetical protein